MVGNQKGTVFKKYQCRYFDRQGRLAHPSRPCVQGDACTFLHPSDKGWPGLPASSPSTTKKKSFDSGKTSSDFNSREPFASNSNDSVRRRGPPLVPQGDLFRKAYKEEVENDDFYSIHARRRSSSGAVPTREWDREAARQRERERNGNRSSKQRSKPSESPRSYSKPSTIPLASRMAVDPLPREKYQGRTSCSVAPEDAKPITAHASEAHMPLLITSHLRPMISTADAKSCTPGPLTHKLSVLFQSLATLSSQALQDSTTHAMSQKKLETFTQISATLSNVSSSAGLAIAPTMNALMKGTQETKEMAERTLAALGQTWEQVFDSFATDIGHIIEGRVQEALETIKSQADAHLPRMESTASSGMKRNISNTLWTQNEGPGESDEKDTKRRKLNLMPAASSSGLDPTDLSFTGIDAILHQMKVKVDQQTRSLHSLARENNELKSIIHTQSTDHASSSPGRSQPGSTPTGPRSERQSRHGTEETWVEKVEISSPTRA